MLARRLLLGLVFVLQWPVCTGRAQPFEVNPITSPRFISLNIDSAAELSPDPDVRASAPGGLGYIADLRAQRLLLANPHVRAISLTGLDNRAFLPTTGSIYYLSQDECVENELASELPPGGCTPLVLDERDRLELSWYGHPTGARALGSTFNGDGIMMPPVPMFLYEQVGASMTNPGALLEFISGSPVPYAPPPRWGDLSSTDRPDGEGSGFRTGQIVLIPGNGIGESTPTLIPDHLRVTGFLTTPFDSVTFTVEALSSNDSNTALPVWIDRRRSDPAPVRLYARCNEMPTMGGGWNYEQELSADGTALLLMDDSICAGGKWYITVTVQQNFQEVVFHTRVSHVRDRDIKVETVGVRFGPELPPPGYVREFPSSAERLLIENALRMAAWRYFGATGGTRIIRSFRVDYRGCPFGTDVCINDSTGANGFCWPVPGNIFLSPGPRPWLSATLMPFGWVGSSIALNYVHENGHCDLHGTNHDEYFEPWALDTVCDLDRGILIQCAHGLMSGQYGMSELSDQRSSFCTDLSHRRVVSMRIRDSSGWDGAPMTVAGPDAISECLDGGTERDPANIDTSMWHQMNTFSDHLVPFTGSTPDNHHYRNFAFDPIRTEVGEIVVVGP